MNRAYSAGGFFPSLTLSAPATGPELVCGSSTRIRSQGTSLFLEKLAKLVYVARQVVSWRRRYNDEPDVMGLYTKLREDRDVVEARRSDGLRYRAVPVSR